jgi:hypothetical protein
VNRVPGGRARGSTLSRLGCACAKHRERQPPRTNFHERQPTSSPSHQTSMDPLAEALRRVIVVDSHKTWTAEQGSTRLDPLRVGHQGHPPANAVWTSKARYPGLSQAEAGVRARACGARCLGGGPALLCRRRGVHWISSAHHGHCEHHDDGCAESAHDRERHGSVTVFH